MGSEGLEGTSLFLPASFDQLQAQVNEYVTNVDALVKLYTQLVQFKQQYSTAIYNALNTQQDIDKNIQQLATIIQYITQQNDYVVGHVAARKVIPSIYPYIYSIRGAEFEFTKLQEMIDAAQGNEMTMMMLIGSTGLGGGTNALGNGGYMGKYVSLCDYLHKEYQSITNIIANVMSQINDNRMRTAMELWVKAFQTKANTYNFKQMSMIMNLFGGFGKMSGGGTAKGMAKEFVASTKPSIKIVYNKSKVKESGEELREDNKEDVGEYWNDLYDGSESPVPYGDDMTDDYVPQSPRRVKKIIKHETTY
jgi:hypothetical protein